MCLFVSLSACNPPSAYCRAGLVGHPGFTQLPVGVQSDSVRLFDPETQIEAYLFNERCVVPQNPGITEALKANRDRVLPVARRRFQTDTSELDRDRLAELLRGLARS